MNNLTKPTAYTPDAIVTAVMERANCDLRTAHAIIAGFAVAKMTAEECEDLLGIADTMRD